jgi:uncharacterized protein YjbJ (UPF0337 family)
MLLSLLVPGGFRNNAGDGKRFGAAVAAATPSYRGTSTSIRPFKRAGAILELESKMDWNRVEGNWKQVKGKVKEKWGKLTDDDLDVVAGRRDQLEGKIQERYGIAKDQVRKDVDNWISSQNW